MWSDVDGAIWMWWRSLSECLECLECLGRAGQCWLPDFLFLITFFSFLLFLHSATRYLVAELACMGLKLSFEVSS